MTIMQLVTTSEALLPLLDAELEDFLLKFAGNRRKDVTFSFYYGETIVGNNPDPDSLLKWWLESLQRYEIGYGFIHIPDLGPMPQYLVTFHSYCPNYYIIDYSVVGAKEMVETFINSESSNHLFDVRTHVNGRMGLRTACTPYEDVKLMTNDIGYIRSNVNIANILRVLKEDGNDVTLAHLECRSEFWTTGSSNHICSVDYGMDMSTCRSGSSKNLRMLQIDPKYLHGRNLLSTNGKSTGIDLGYFWLYKSINLEKGTSSYYIEIRGCDYKTFDRN